MDISRRIEKLEAHRKPRPSMFDASALTDSELQELMDKRETGGEVRTEAYGLLKFAPAPTVIGSGYST